MAAVQLLLVEEEDTIRALLQKLLRREGYAVVGFARAPEAVAQLRGGWVPGAVLANFESQAGRLLETELARSPILTGVPRVDTAGDVARIADRVAEMVAKKPADPTDIDPLEFVAQNYGQMAARLPELVARMRELGTAAGTLDQIEPSLEQAQRGARQMRSFVRYLRDYGRAAADSRAPIDPRPALEFALETADHLLAQSAVLQVEITALPTVMAHERKLSHVFLSLLVNAAQAIGRAAPQSNRVRVRARTDEHGWLQVEVSDSGPGIAPEILPKIFEPYFTTKQGAGLGLGLFQSRLALAAWGGSIACTSTELGRGSVFRVELPPAAPRSTR